MENEYGPSPLAKVYKLIGEYLEQEKRIYSFHQLPACQSSVIMDFENPKEEKIEGTFLGIETYRQTTESIYAGLGIPEKYWYEYPTPKEHNFTIQLNAEQIKDIKKWIGYIEDDYVVTPEFIKKEEECQNQVEKQ